MIHITATGVYAGTPICGISREEAIEKGDKLCHMPHRPSKKFIEELCADCLRIYFK